MSLTRRHFAALAAAPLLRAQSAQDRGREVANKAIHALGGDGFRQMRTRTEIGKAYSFYRQQITGLSAAHIYTEYLNEGTIRERQRQVFGKKQDDAVILTADGAWETTFRGSKNLGPDRLKQFHDITLNDIFYILRARIDEPGIVFEHKGKDVVELSPVETIEIYDSENRNVTAWIHSSSFLPIRQRYRYWDPLINDRREQLNALHQVSVKQGTEWSGLTHIQRERDNDKTSRNSTPTR